MLTMLPFLLKLPAKLLLATIVINLRESESFAWSCPSSACNTASITSKIKILSQMLRFVAKVCIKPNRTNTFLLFTWTCKEMSGKIEGSCGHAHWLLCIEIHLRIQCNTAWKPFQVILYLFMEWAKFWINVARLGWAQKINICECLAHLDSESSVNYYHHEKFLSVCLSFHPVSKGFYSQIIRWNMYYSY